MHVATVFSLFVFVELLFKGGLLFHWKACGCQQQLNKVQYFFDQTPWLLLFLPLAFVRLHVVFKDGIYFFGKPADINNSWIKYEQVIQQQPLDTISSMQNLSVLLPAVETSHTTQTVLVLAC